LDSLNAVTLKLFPFIKPGIFELSSTDFFGATELAPATLKRRAHMVGDHTLHTTSVTAI
jgi:hypothetical protein